MINVGLGSDSDERGHHQGRLLYPHEQTQSARKRTWGSNVGFGTKATKSEPTNFFRFRIAMGQNLPNEEHRPKDRFVIRKRTFGEAAANDCFWPIPAVGVRASRMTAMGQLRTLATYRCHVCFQG